MSQICTPHSSPRRTPVIAASHTYSAMAGLPAVRACSITVTTAPGGVARVFFFLTVGGFADSAGLKSTHSQRRAASNAPDRMLWMPWMVQGTSRHRHRSTNRSTGQLVDTLKLQVGRQGV